MAAFHFNQDFLMRAERTPERLCFEGVYEPMSRFACHTNILSVESMNLLKTRWMESGALQDNFRIRTGGGRMVTQPNGQEIMERWPARFVPVWRLNRGNFELPAASLARAEMQSFFDERLTNPQPGDPENYELPNMFRVNPHYVLWRLDHVLPGGQARMLPVTVELSHHAESYHSATFLGANYHPEWKVEAFELESPDVNESRKVCKRYAFMWRKYTGESIPLAEADTYSGLTMCWHATLLGTPCYGPHPEEPEAIAIGGRKPTGQTPSRRGGRGSGGTSGREMAKRGRKKGSEPVGGRQKGSKLPKAK